MTPSLAYLRTRPLIVAGVGVAVVLIALASYAELTYAWSIWQEDGGRDIRSYLGAAERLRDGLPLYQPGAPNDTSLYRYAPWFAALWVPLLGLPRDMVLAGWIGLLLAASAASVVPLLRMGPSGVPAAVFFLGFQLEGAAYGNVQPLMIALLMWGVTRASGPLWIALAASLKAVPIVYVLVYVARREGRRAAATIAFTAVLVAPMLLFDLSGYSTEPGPRQMSLISVSPWLFLTVAVVGSLVTLRLGSGRFGWLAASVTAALWLPRMLTYEVSFVLVGLAEALRRRAVGSDASRNVRS